MERAQIFIQNESHAECQFVFYDFLIIHHAYFTLAIDIE